MALPTFHWLWTLDIINDYERGAEVVEADERIMRRAEFDRVGFQLFLAALQLEPPVVVSVTTMRMLGVAYRKRRALLSVILTMLFIWPVR